jgi:phenylacetate-CoA ligase
MSFFHLRTLPGYDWPALADATLGQIWVAYLQLDRTQWLSPAEIEQGQLEQVRSLLAHCITDVPYYRGVLPLAGIVPGAIRTMADFRRIPRLPRRTYQEQFASFAATRLPAGTVATTTRNTAGSSGSPLVVLQTNVVHLWWFALYPRDLEWSGINPAGTLAAIRSTGQKGKVLERLIQGMSQSGWLNELGPLLVPGTAHLMDIQQDPRVQVQWLRRIAPEYLLSYPSSLEVLANLIRADGPIRGLKAIQAISETLADEVRDSIESAFGGPVKNLYSCAEAGYLASPCPKGHGLHVHSENVLLEVLDAEGRPCKPGESGQVYLTNMNNLRCPFIRYELGDVATVGAEPCPCGRGLPLLASVQRKLSPLFHLPNGRSKSSIAVTRLLRKLGGHWQHQFVQQATDHVTVRLAINTEWTARHEQDLRDQVETFFEAPLRIDLEIHDRLPMPASGKFQSMINAMTSASPSAAPAR